MEQIFIFAGHQAYEVRKIVENIFPNSGIKVVTDMKELPADIKEVIVANINDDSNTTKRAEDVFADECGELTKDMVEQIEKSLKQALERQTQHECHYDEMHIYEKPVVEGYTPAERKRIDKANKQKEAKNRRNQNTNALRYMNKHYKK